jgi:hypothetical protein
MTTTSTITAIANDLLERWESAIRKFQNSPARETTALLPTALDLYQMGCVLHTTNSNMHGLASSKLVHKNNLERCCRLYLQALPETYRTKVFLDLDQSFRNVLQATGDTDDEGRTQAIDAMNQLYSVLTKSSIKSSLVAILSSWNIDTLSSLVEIFRNTNNPSILSLLEIYLLNTNEFEKLLPALHLLQETVWDELTKSIEKHNRHWKEQLVSNFDLGNYNHDNAQKDYLTMMLANSHSEEAKIAKQSQITASQKKLTTKPAASTASPLFSHNPTSTKGAAEDEIQRRIDHIRAVLPHLGEGFIEIALSQHQGNVETTMAQLIDEEQWPETWKSMDYRNLPRSHDKQVAARMKQEEEAAKQVTKAIVRETDRRQEELALLLERVAVVDEYDDDYDDQYDDIMGEGANAVPDNFLYDDFDAIRAYNTTLKSVEAESAFWNENRNTNRPPRKNDDRSMSTIEQDEPHDGQGNQAKQYRGPDKMRGGRIPGRGRGREGRGQQQQQPKKKSNDPASTTDHPSGGIPSKNKPNLRAKSHKLDKRREQQKKAQAKRSDGGM